MGSLLGVKGITKQVSDIGKVFESALLAVGKIMNPYPGAATQAWVLKLVIKPSRRGANERDSSELKDVSFRISR